MLLKNQRKVLQERRTQFLKKICSAPLVLDTCTLMDLGCFFEKHECHDVLYKYREDMSLDEAHQNYFLQEKFWYCDQAIIHLYKTAHVILLLEKACKQRSTKIIIHRHVYRELQNIYNLNDKEKSPKAQRAKRLIERWQKLGIVQV